MQPINKYSFSLYWTLITVWFTSLHHPLAERFGRLPGGRSRSVAAIGGPSVPLGGAGRAWRQIPGWGHQSVCGPTTRKVSQSCNLTWLRYRSTGREKFGV